MTVRLDLTPWTRGPHSGVGLTARLTFESLVRLNRVPLVGVSRDLSAARPHKLSWLSPLGRCFGEADGVYHGFETRLPSVRRSRVLLTVHDCWTLWPNEWQSASFQARQRPKFISALQRADLFMVPSEHVKRELTRWDAGMGERARVVPWAPLFTGRVREAAVGDLPSDLQALASRPFVLSVGVFERRKNQTLLLRALRGRRDVDVVLVGGEGHGSGEVLREIEAARASGLRVHAFRALSHAQLLWLTTRSLACVQASFDEGFGLPVVEAMACARPLLLSRVPVLQEIGAEAAQYFDPRTGSEELTHYIDLLLRNEATRARWGMLSHERVRAFSWDQSALKVLDLYAEVAKKPAGSSAP